LSVDAAASAVSTATRNHNESLLSGNSMQSVLLSRFNHIISSVELNTVITKVDYSSGKVQLTGEKRSEEGGMESFTLEVDKVIIAVPVSIISTGEMVFVPGLPDDKLNSLTRIGTDSSIRVVLDFKQNFWGKDVGSIYGGQTGPEYLSTGIGRSDFNKTMSITINGSKAAELSAKGDEMINDILLELDTAFEGKASKNIRRDEADNIIYAIKDWSKDPYIKGGVSYIKPGGTAQDREQVGTSVQSMVFFAGEATHSSDPGTINGALLSAERVVVEVVKSIVGA
jgi:monoamine oxidase